MRSNFVLDHLVRVTAVMGVLLISTMARRQPPESRFSVPQTQGICAAYDHHLSMLIGDLGLTGGADPLVPAAAAMDVLAARTACVGGDTLRG
jgi:hypothetical protein